MGNLTRLLITIFGSLNLFLLLHPAFGSTRSPGFLGLNHNAGGIWRESNYGRGVIIGVLSSGVTPGHPSFADDGMPPPPRKWRGRCDLPAPYTCNNKLIGARVFGSGTALDTEGGGTHTSSLAAGNFVKGANVFGNAYGIAAGIAPRAHIASYKVCGDCSDNDILAGLNAAIHDGVDIILMNLGSGPTFGFYDNVNAIAAFRAAERGILVSIPGGNRGPERPSVRNGAPWILTVGASTIDRRILATAVLGNSRRLNGESNNQPKNFPSKALPLVFPGLRGSDSERHCESFANTTSLQGKIVVCAESREALIDAITQGQNVKNAGAAAMILFNDEEDTGGRGYTIISRNHVLPATALSYADGQRIIAYLNSSTSRPKTARLYFRGTVIGDRTAPTVASYSGRGTNRLSRAILKPDIIGPGQNILGAWHASVENKSNTNFNFNIQSGTSFASAHLAGAAALLKKIHPTWSPAAIKSALMTTAGQLNLAHRPIQDGYELGTASIFAIGSGHLNIQKAADPGLIYDTHPSDYLPYLCGLNYTDEEVRQIVNRPVNCSVIGSIRESDLNYPSLAVSVFDEPVTFNRTVTNVGLASEVYTAEFSSTFPTVDIAVKPRTLKFTKKNQKLTYRVTVTPHANATTEMLEGSLTWTSSHHSVRSPVAIFVHFLFE